MLTAHSYTVGNTADRRRTRPIGQQAESHASASRAQVRIRIAARTEGALPDRQSPVDVGLLGDLLTQRFEASTPEGVEVEHGVSDGVARDPEQRRDRSRPERRADRPARPGRLVPDRHLSRPQQVPAGSLLTTAVEPADVVRITEADDHRRLDHRQDRLGVARQRSSRVPQHRHPRRQRWAPRPRDEVEDDL